MESRIRHVYVEAYVCSLYNKKYPFPLLLSRAGQYSGNGPISIEASGSWRMELSFMNVDGLQCAFVFHWNNIGSSDRIGRVARKLDFQCDSSSSSSHHQWLKVKTVLVRNQNLGILFGSPSVSRRTRTAFKYRRPVTQRSTFQLLNVQIICLRSSIADSDRPIPMHTRAM